MCDQVQSQTPVNIRINLADDYQMLATKRVLDLFDFRLRMERA